MTRHLNVRRIAGQPQQENGMTDRIGTLEDVGKSVCVCDVCDYVAWDGGRDGDPCPECEER